MQEHKQEFGERYGITKLGIFGSVARDEAVDSSDVDVVVEMAPDMFARANLKKNWKQFSDQRSMWYVIGSV